MTDSTTPPTHERAIGLAETVDAAAAGHAHAATVDASEFERVAVPVRRAVHPPVAAIQAFVATGSRADAGSGGGSGAGAGDGIAAHLRRCPTCAALALLVTPSTARVIPRSLYGDRALLGEGGMGRTYLARDKRLGREVVIKELKPARLLDPPGERARMGARLEREAKLVARLSHPSIISVFEIGCWPDGELFYAMEHVQGESLDAIVERIGERFAAAGDDSPEALAARLRYLPALRNVIDAMAYAHDEGVVHRDLTPRNLLVVSDSDAVVIDWGLAKRIGNVSGGAVAPRGGSETTGSPLARLALAMVDDLDSGGGDQATAAGLGTPSYCSPEQARGEAPDPRFDVYALGATLHFLLAGRQAFGGSNVAEILSRQHDDQRSPLPPSCPPELAAIVDKALAFDPSQRYATARELADELSRYESDKLVGAYRYSPIEKLWRFVRRQRTAVRAAALMALVAAIVGAVFFSRVKRKHNVALGRAQRVLEARHNKQVAAIRARQQQRLSKLRRRQSGDLGRAKVLHEKQRKQLAARHARQMALARAELRGNVAGLKAKLGLLQVKHTGELEALEAKQSGRLSQLAEQHKGELAAARARHDGALAALKAKQTADVLALRTQHKGELAALRRKHDAALAAQKARSDKLLAAARARIDANKRATAAARAAARAAAARVATLCRALGPRARGMAACRAAAGGGGGGGGAGGGGGSGAGTVKGTSSGAGSAPGAGGGGASGRSSVGAGGSGTGTGTGAGAAAGAGVPTVSGPAPLEPARN